MLMKRIIFARTDRSIMPPQLADLRKNILFYILLLTLLGGVAAGAAAGRTIDRPALERLDIVFLTDFTVRCSQGALSSFVASFASGFLFMLVLILGGSSLWGAAVCFAVPFIKGYGYGLGIGFLYSSYGLQGILYNILVILPGAFLCSVVIAAASLESLRSSLGLASQFIRSAVSDDPTIRMKKYLLSMLWLLFLTAVSSGADMLFSMLFSWMFNFG